MLIYIYSAKIVINLHGWVKMKVVSIKFCITIVIVNVTHINYSMKCNGKD